MKTKLLSWVTAIVAIAWSANLNAQCTVQTAPYTEDFEMQTGGSSTSPNLPSCWTSYLGVSNASVYSTYGYAYNSSTYANSGSKSFRFYKSSSSSYVGDTAAYMSPKFNLGLGTYEVKFSARSFYSSSFYSNTIYIGVADSAGSTASITIIDTLTRSGIAGTVHTPYQLDLSTAAGVTSTDSRVVFMSKCDGSTGYIAMDDVQIRVKNSCDDVTNLLASTTSTGIGVSWDGSTSHTSYTVEYDTTGFTPGNGTTVTVTTDTAHITGLTPALSYDIYVNGVCSSTSSGYSTKSSGFAPCAPLTTYSTSFEGATGSSSTPTLPVCWMYATGVSNGSSFSTYHYVYGYYGNTGSNSLRTYRSSSSFYLGDTALSISPEIQGLDSATKMIEFYGRKGYALYPGEVIIGVTNANGDASSLKIVDTVYMDSDTYSKYTVYLDAAAGVGTGDSRIAFVSVCNGVYDYMYIDDVSVMDIPPCPEPIGLALTGTTRSTGTVAWSSSASAFDMEVGPMGFVQGTGTSYTSTTTSATATGLTQNTYYDAYVRANCSAAGDGYSTWVGPFTFKTECGWFTAPYNQTFGYSDGSGSSVNPDLPDCWSYYETNGSSGYAYVDKYWYYGNVATDSAYIFLNSGYTSTTTALDNDTIMAILPLVYDLGLNDKQLLFSAKGYSGAGIGAQLDAVIIGTIDSLGSVSSMNIIDTIPMLGNTYSDYSVDLTGVPLTGGDRVFMSVWKGLNAGYSYGYNEVYVDYVTVRQAPQCPEVYDVVASATSDTSATMSWGDSSVVDEYVIEWGPSGFTQATGAPMDTVIGTTWSNMNLLPGTSYDVYVLSVCQAMGVNSPWYGPITIDMPCSPVSAPFADGFEVKPTSYGGSTNPNLPDCWIYDSKGSSYSYASTSSFSAYSGTGYMYNRQVNIAGDTVVVSLPMIENLDQGGLELRFWARLLSATYPGQMAVATTDAGGTISSIEVAKDMKVVGNTYAQYSVYLDSNVVSAGQTRPALMFYSVDGSYNYIYTDSVEVLAMPACISYNHTESNVTDTSADLSWSYTGNNIFNVEYGMTGFIQGTGVGAQAGTLDTLITSPYTMSGLNPNTTYDYYVENVCNPGAWEGPFTFTTECTGPLTAGTYTVGATGDFATLDSVMGVLNVCGISGAVTFEFQSGSYRASSPLSEVNGSSISNTITFKGGTGNDTITASSDAAFVLEGAKYMTFEDLYFNSASASAIRLNGTSDITIKNNVIESSSTASTVGGVIASASATSAYSVTPGEKNLTVSNNEISGVYHGIRLYGSFGGKNENINISGNTFTDIYYYGIYVYYGTDVVIDNNTLSDFGNAFNYAIYNYYCDGVSVKSNHISNASYAIYSQQIVTTSLSSISSEYSNNMVVDAGNYGLYIGSSDSVGIYHNTFTGLYGLRDYNGSAKMDVRNNIFQGRTYAIYNYNALGNYDNNLYYSTNANGMVANIYNGTYSYPTDLASLQAVDVTKNLNSLVGDPVFASATDLHVFGPLANDAGDNTVGILVDIDGDVRPSVNATTVDIGADEYDVIADDVALNAIVSPSDGACGGDSIMISVEIANYGQNTITALTVNAEVLGQTFTVTPTWGLNLPFGSTATVMMGYVSNLVGGPMTVMAYASVPNDGRPGNDTLISSIEIGDAQQVAVSYPAILCPGDDAVMNVIHPLTGVALWMSGNDTLAIAGVDSTITLSNITTDTTITVSTISVEEVLVTPIPTGSWGAVDGPKFTTTQALTIDSVTIYPMATSGTEDVTIRDETTGLDVGVTSVSWSTSSAYAPVRVAIGIPVGVGNYSLGRRSPVGSWREQSLFSIGGYPIYSADSTLYLTGQITYQGYLSYFFDWKFTVGGCDREDTTFTVEVHPDPVASITVDSANATITSTDWSASWDASGTTDADSVYVEFSNGTTSNSTSGTVTFTANMAGETVTVIAFGPCTSDTATFTFDVNQISVDEDFMNGSLSIYPNPTRGLFNVEFATEQAKDVEITIVNMLGQVVSTDVVEVNGVYNNQFDLSNESAGVYFITFTTDEGVLTQRITVE